MHKRRWHCTQYYKLKSLTLQMSFGSDIISNVWAMKSRLFRQLEFIFVDTFKILIFIFGINAYDYYFCTEHSAIQAK